MRNLDNKVTRSDSRITWEIKEKTLHVNKAMHNNPAELSTMILWAVQNPFGRIGGDAGPITHRHRRSALDFETEVEMTDTEIEEVRSPASTVTQYQFQPLMPLQGDTPRQLVQSDTIMIDAPSIDDQQLAAMIRQVQGASAYLYKLSEDDRNNAKHQYNHLIEIVTDLQKGFTDESMKTANISAGIYEEFHRGSIDFARQIYEKLNEHETEIGRAHV